MDTNNRPAPFGKATFDLINSPNYLGNGAVAELVARGFVGGFGECEKEEDYLALVDKYALILAGEDKNYTADPDYHNRFKCGMVIAEWCKADPNQSYIDLCRFFFLYEMEQLISTSRKVADGVAEDIWHGEIDMVVEEIQTMLQGTFTTVYAEEMAAAREAEPDPPETPLT